MRQSTFNRLRLLGAGRAFQALTVLPIALLLLACSTSTGTEPEPTPVVARIDLQPAALALQLGDSAQLSARAYDDRGREMAGRLVTWSTQHPAVASVSASGTVTTLGAGTATIMAQTDGVSASATVVVSAAPAPRVTTISVSPGASVIEIGEQRQYVATVKDQYGNVLTDHTIHWTVDNSNATITTGGVLTGRRNGYVTVTAASEGVSFSVGGTIVEPVPLDWDLLYHRVSHTSESELFVLPLSGGAAPIRLNAGTVSRSATPSPDGLRIAFAVSMVDLTGERVDDLFAVDRNGMNMKRLTTDPANDDAPDWSPTASRIAWVRWEANGRSDIWVMNADGTGQVNLTADMPAGAIRREPAWSRDGARIAFAEFENGVAGTRASIWIMNADGSNRRMLTSKLNGFDTSPTWAPGGQQLAFTRYYGPQSDITVIEVETGTLRRIEMPGLESAPAWSPDGSVIAFSLNGNALYTVRPDGGQLRLRTTDPGWGGGLSPSWISRQQ